ncbi:MAG: sugar O-acetyltransferase [Bacteroidetes bacterium]|uniref:Sugar O-acetyltransferase n=1 Tax=Candidatus Egerieousia excrementavium TaxID=2840778 RepID=A0A9D9GW97_9BACT|nr:sugar O-acetyltransferase [Candidatus Egerieousia excrementavium]
MTVGLFQKMIADRKPLEGEEMIEFMREQSDNTRRLLVELNNNYHTADQIRSIFARITGNDVPDSFRMFPPFYTDFGKNIHVGENVFINAGCHFQDQGGIFIGDGSLIGHCVVMATLNHGFEPERRQALSHAPIRLGKGVWIGAHATILQGVTIGDNAVVAAGAVVSKDVEANTVVGGVPARFIKYITPDFRPEEKV